MLSLIPFCNRQCTGLPEYETREMLHRSGKWPYYSFSTVYNSSLGVPLTVEIGLMTTEKVPYMGGICDYRIYGKSAFNVEALSKQLLHGISGAYKSKRALPNHAHCSYWRVTG